MDNWNETGLDVNEYLVVCTCGSFVDLRDPSDVIKHLHSETEARNNIIENDPAAHPKNFSRII